MNHPSVVRRRFGAALLAVAALGSVSAAHAADPFPIPGKPIVLVLPALGGSTGDRVLRMYGDRMRDEWKVPVIVEQKPGKAQAFALGERDAVAYLKSLGAKVRHEIAGDFIVSWDD